MKRVFLLVSCNQITENNNPSMLSQVLFIPIVLLILFGFVLVRYILPYFGGWKDLEAHFQTDKDPKYEPVTKLKIRRCNIGGMGYENVVKFYAMQEGLLLKQIWLFRAGQKSVLIPWKEIKDMQEKKVLFNKIIRLVIGDPFVTFIEIRKTDFLKMENYLK